jgi:hypothetical protein
VIDTPNKKAKLYASTCSVDINRLGYQSITTASSATLDTLGTTISGAAAALYRRSLRLSRCTPVIFGPGIWCLGGTFFDVAELRQ